VYTPPCVLGTNFDHWPRARTTLSTCLLLRRLTRTQLADITATDMASDKARASVLLQPKVLQPKCFHSHRPQHARSIHAPQHAALSCNHRTAGKKKAATSVTTPGTLNTTHKRRQRPRGTPTVNQQHGACTLPLTAWPGAYSTHSTIALQDTHASLPNEQSARSGMRLFNVSRQAMKAASKNACSVTPPGNGRMHELSDNPPTTKAPCKWPTTPTQVGAPI
jgi:hypothetical protein